MAPAAMTIVSQLIADARSRLAPTTA